MSITHVAIAGATVVTEPAAPSPSDVVTVIYRIESFNAPLTIESVSFDRDGSEVNVLVSLIQGTYSEVDVVNGSVQVGSFPPGTYGVNLYARWRYGFDGAPFHDPYVAAISQFTVQSQVQATSVSEYYHQGLNHYFLTGNADEAASLNSNPQLDWQPTGQSFRALTALSYLTGPLNAVCRFYGSIAPGPNSHFYTLDSTECNFLKQLQQTTPATLLRWNFEGIDFVAAAPQLNGTCPDEYPLAVRRFYNDRALQADSNHRYVTDDAVAQQMRAAGWLDEGIVMCGLAG